MSRTSEQLRIDVEDWDITSEWSGVEGKEEDGIDNDAMESKYERLGNNTEGEDGSSSEDEHGSGKLSQHTIASGCTM